jgi:hypothetical protein
MIASATTPAISFDQRTVDFAMSKLPARRFFPLGEASGLRFSPIES